MRKLITADIETSDGLDGCKFELGVVYDGTNPVVFDKEKDFCRYIAGLDRNCKIYFHNLSFDGRFLQQYLLDSGIKFETFYRNSNILEIAIAKDIYVTKDGEEHTHYLTICDSYALIPRALEKFPDIFDLSIKKLSLENKEKRCINDVKILYEGLMKFYGILPASEECFTIAQTSLTTFINECDLKYNFTSNGYEVETKLEKEAKEGYFGGRTEIFNLNRCDKIYCYDINSLYPYVMRDKPYPVSIKEVKANKKVLEEDLYYVYAKMKIPYSFIPILPMKINSKLMFCYGNMEGWFYSPEFNLIKDVAEEIEIKKAYVFTPCFLFKYFIEKYYKMRKDAKLEGNEIEYVYKILLNSLYGKFAQNRDKESLFYTNDLDEYDNMEELYEGIYVKKIPHFNSSAKINPFVSGFITSYSRCEIAKYLNEDTFQTDTDSIFTPVVHNTGEELGQLKLEYSGEFKAICPKTYWMKTDKGDIITKAKGVINPPKSDNPIDYEKALRFNKWRIYGKSKESIRRKGSFLFVKDVVKELNLAYDKRKILSDMTTKPYNVKEV